MLLGMEMVWLEADCSRYEFFLDVISETKPDIGVINIDADHEKAFALIERMKTDLRNAPSWSHRPQPMVNDSACHASWSSRVHHVTDQHR